MLLMRMLKQNHIKLVIILFLNDKVQTNLYLYIRNNDMHISPYVEKYTYSCMLYFVGKTGVPVQEILTSNAVSLYLKICIYIYVEHKYPERRTI
jgi:uncharacterized membrane protein